MTLGVYIATHGNPVYLRHTIAQLLLQEVSPSIVAIHENGYSAEGSYRWVIRDYEEMFFQRNIDLVYDYTPVRLTHPAFHLKPLMRLYDVGCKYFMKWDHDDIFYRRHLGGALLAIAGKEADAYLKTKADVLELHADGTVKRFQDAEWSWNPTGAMSDSVIFNRKLAKRYLDLMQTSKAFGRADDVLLGEILNAPDVSVVRDSGTPGSAVYVSHGRNTSGALWGNPEYIRQKKERNNGQSQA
jgi:hypothetical protein